jgi:hypothetical protein
MALRRQLAAAVAQLGRLQERRNDLFEVGTEANDVAAAG